MGIIFCQISDFAKQLFREITGSHYHDKVKRCLPDIEADILPDPLDGHTKIYKFTIQNVKSLLIITPLFIWEQKNTLI